MTMKITKETVMTMTMRTMKKSIRKFVGAEVEMVDSFFLLMTTLPFVHPDFSKWKNVYEPKNLSCSIRDTCEEEEEEEGDLDKNRKCLIDIASIF
jgi:hypothetical protein